MFLAYASSGGDRALIDRELYLPQQSWCADRDRCRRGGVPDDVVFATKPELARAMIERAVRAGVPFSWVAGDEVYGQNPQLRSWLEQQHVSYVMAVPCSELVATAGPRMRADALAALVPARGWQMLSCGDGAKGPRFYDWALIATASGDHQLLARRSLTPNEKGKLELAFFTCYAPAGATLGGLVAVAGARWAVESCFQAAKNETGLDHYQVRRYDAWYRHITLSMLALAFLAVIRGAAKKGTRGLWTIPADRQDKHPGQA